MFSSHRQELFVAWRILALGFVVGCVTTRPAQAHKGPPFPLMMDQRVADYSVSIWADPDIGDATFYIVVEKPGGGLPDTIPEVSMWTEPISGRLERVTYEATRQELRDHVQFAAKPYFDQGDMWNVEFRIKPIDGEAGELVAQVESTPPGTGPWDLAIYLFPFLLIGGMWVVAAVRRSRAARRSEDDETPACPEEPQREPALAASETKDWK